MYRGFKIENFRFTSAVDKEIFLSIGNDMYNAKKKQIEESLSEFIFLDNSLDGSKIQRAWFPQIQCDVFISHSHSDKDLALSLAGWLNNEFHIRSFIDSCIWSYADTLLKKIDDRYCKNPSGETYSYQKRNKSTSHVHMMLSAALSAMMDRTECLFFLNTPSSVTFQQGISQTESPWLYFEIGMSQYIRKKEPERFLIKSERYYSEGGILEKAIKAKYEVDLSHLTTIDIHTLNKWSNIKNRFTAEDSLDALYGILPAKKYSDSLHG